MMNKALAMIILIAITAKSLQTLAQKEQQKLSSIELPVDFQKTLTDYEHSWKTSNTQALARLFTKNGYVLTPDRPIVQGRSNIQKIYAQAGGNLFLEAHGYDIHGDIAYIIGGYRSDKVSDPIGKFILILNKVDQQWMIKADMDSRNSKL